MNATLLERTGGENCKMPIEIAQESAVVQLRTSRWAVAGVAIAFASFVVWSILSLATPLPGVVAVVFGLIAKMRIRRNPARIGGRIWASLSIIGGFSNLLLLTALLYLSKPADRDRYLFNSYG
jgi:hypothetical protein